MFPDHVTARWEGVPLNSQSALIDADDGATVITDTIKDDAERQEPKSCPQQTVKVSFASFLSVSQDLPGELSGVGSCLFRANCLQALQRRDG